MKQSDAIKRLATLQRCVRLHSFPPIRLFRNSWSVSFSMVYP